VPILSISFIFDTHISALVIEENGTTSISINPDSGFVSGGNNKFLNKFSKNFTGEQHL
jgi:hypothetical protein